MKKTCTIILAFVLFLSMFCEAFAFENESSGLLSTNQQNEYTYTNYVDENGRIIRSYSKNNNQQNTSSIFSTKSVNSNTTIQSETLDTQSMLSNLGMSDTFIDALSSDSLDMYSNAACVTSVTTYSKTDKNGNVTIVDEETALSRSATINSSRVITLPEDFGSGEGNGEVPTHYHDTKTKEGYMKITLTVSVLGEGNFHYSVDAEWLTTPIFRYYNSLGICVKNNRVIEGTQSGWVKYNRKKEFVGQEPTSEQQQTTITSDLTEQVENGDWLGIGFIYLVPEDIIMPFVYSDCYRDFKAHFEFKGQVENPSIESYFYATSTYEYIVYNAQGTDSTIYPAPDFKITLSGTQSYISMDTLFDTEPITVPICLPIHHVP